METNTISYSKRAKIRNLNFCRIISILGVAALSAALFYWLRDFWAAGILALVAGFAIANALFTRKYKEEVVFSMIKGLKIGKSMMPDLLKYELEADANRLDSEDCLCQENGMASFAEIKILKSGSKSEITLLEGNAYFCRLRFDTSNTLLIYSAGWSHRASGTKRCDILDGQGVDCHTVSGEINGRLRKIVEEAIIQAVKEMRLSKFAVIVDGSLLCIIEEDSTDHFDIHLLSRIRSKIDSDAIMLQKIRHNLEILDKLAAETGQPAETGYTAARPCALAGQELSAAACKDGDAGAASVMAIAEPAEIDSIAGRLQSGATPELIVYGALGLLWIAAIGLLLLGSGIALMIAIFASITLPKYLINRIFLKRAARELFGGKASASYSKSKSSILIDGCRIGLAWAAGSAAATIAIPSVLDQERQYERISAIMSRLPQYTTYCLERRDGHILLSISGVGIRPYQSSGIKDSVLRANISDLLMIKEILGGALSAEKQ